MGAEVMIKQLLMGSGVLLVAAGLGTLAVSAGVGALMVIWGVVAIAAGHRRA
jgi:hypothetical protein